MLAFSPLHCSSSFSVNRFRATHCVSVVLFVFAILVTVVCGMDNQPKVLVTVDDLLKLDNSPHNRQVLLSFADPTLTRKILDAVVQDHQWHYMDHMNLTSVAVVDAINAVVKDSGETLKNFTTSSLKKLLDEGSYSIEDLISVRNANPNMHKNALMMIDGIVVSSLVKNSNIHELRALVSQKVTTNEDVVLQAAQQNNLQVFKEFYMDLEPVLCSSKLLLLMLRQTLRSAVARNGNVEMLKLLIQKDPKCVESADIEFTINESLESKNGIPTFKYLIENHSQNLDKEKMAKIAFKALKQGNTEAAAIIRGSALLSDLSLLYRCGEEKTNATDPLSIQAVQYLYSPSNYTTAASLLAFLGDENGFKWALENSQNMDDFNVDVVLQYVMKGKSIERTKLRFQNYDGIISLLNGMKKN